MLLLPSRRSPCSQPLGLRVSSQAEEGSPSRIVPTWLQGCVVPDLLLAPGKTRRDQIPGQLHALGRPEATGDLKGVSC